MVRRDIQAAIADHLAAQFGDGLPVTWVDQREALGTGHAVLVATEALAARGAQAPAAFAVANGDDLYGPGALELAFTALGRVRAHAGPHPLGMLVPFEMQATLSAEGGVSRGWVHADAAGRVERVQELREVQRAGDALHGIDAEGDPPATLEVPPAALASMNLWVLPLSISVLLRDRFERQGPSPVREFTLSTALDDAVGRGELQLEVTPCATGWMGVTFGADAIALRRHLATPAMRARYPDPLSRALEDTCS